MNTHLRHGDVLLGAGIYDIIAPLSNLFHASVLPPIFDCLWIDQIDVGTLIYLIPYANLCSHLRLHFF